MVRWNAGTEHVQTQRQMLSPAGPKIGIQKGFTHKIHDGHCGSRRSPSCDDAGADALGFIFASSKRRVTVERAQAMIRRLPPGIERIGVFLDATPEQIRDTVAEIELTGIQLHGEGVTLDVYEALPEGRRESLRIIKTIIVRDAFEFTIDGIAAQGVVDAWLLDSGAGSGNPFDWKIVRTAFNHWHGDLLWNDVNRRLGNRRARSIIAGGLNPENVGQAMKFSRPGASTLSPASSANPVARIPKK
jgi:phosphoribosylanthranilate isomerase